MLAPSLTDAPTALKSPLSSASRIASLDAGAGHFLLITAGPSPQVLSYGDNRFSQLGVPPSSATAGEQLCHVDFFDGLEPIIIRAGGLHSAVVTADGSLYMFGDDAKGQCGGFGGQPPALVSLVGEVDQGLSDDEPEVRDVALGSAHTVVITDKGVYVTGSSESSTGRLRMQWLLMLVHPRPRRSARARKHARSTSICAEHCAPGQQRSDQCRMRKMEHAFICCIVVTTLTTILRLCQSSS